MSQIQITNASDELLSCELHSGIQPYYVLLHGLGAYKEIGVIDSLWKLLTKQTTHGVVRFDFSGCGHSQGLFQESTFSKQTSDLKSVLSYLNTEQGISEVVLVGHSMGGAVSLLASNHERISGIVCLTAPIFLSDVHNKRPELFSVGNQVPIARKKGSNLPNREYTISQQWLDDANQVDVYNSIPENIPVFGIYAKHDSIIDSKNAAALKKKGNEVLFVNDTHLLLQSAQEIVDTIIKKF